MSTTIDRLNAECVSTTDPSDTLAVRPSDEPGCKYEVYAGGYGLSLHCRTAEEARQCIRDHYRELAAQGRS